MVVLSKPAILVKLPLIEACAKPPALFTEIPVIDLQHPWAKNLIVKSCEEFGFFKLVNHGVPLEFMTRLEDETVRFFNLPQHQKDRAGPPDPFGYGSKRIGLNGDVGWVEYLLLNTNAGVTSLKTTSILEANPERFRTALRDYITAVKRMAAEVLELVAEGLGLEPRNLLSRLVKDEQSDSCFRLNHYPPCPEAQLSRGGGGRKFLGFGEHTDPQIISVLRSNNTSGLQICLNDGSWVSVPPDHTSFFINVGDALQVPHSPSASKFFLLKFSKPEIISSMVSLTFFFIIVRLLHLNTKIKLLNKNYNI